MFLLAILEVVFIVVLVVFGLTQVVIPIISRKPLFPLFHRHTKLEGELEDLKEEKELDELRDRIDAAREHVRKSNDTKYY
jgi:hypothetical protein